MKNDPSTTPSAEKQKFILKRLTGVVWFFLCLFGALAAISVGLKALKYPNWELYYQLGFIGQAAVLVIMGSVQLGWAFMKKVPTLERFMRATGFLLGISGALFTLGTFFWLLKYPNYEVFLSLGIKGGATGLVLFGCLRLGEVFAMEPPDENGGGSGDEL